MPVKLMNIQRIISQSLRNATVRRQSSQTTSTEIKSEKPESFGGQYCMSLVEKNDYENFLCTLLVNEKHRRHAFALRAFNVEVAKSGANVTEQMIGKMRIQFWHDSLDKCFSTKASYVADHPVLKELQNTLSCHKLNKVHLKRLISARSRQPNEQFLTMQQLEEYAEMAFSSLYHLLVQLTGVNDMQIDHAASHLGKAQGIATLLRAIPYTGRGQALSIPQEILVKHDVSQERVLRIRPDDKGVEECVFEVATAAHQHLAKARSLGEKLPNDVRKLFLPAVAVERYLERLRKANFNLADQRCLRRDAMLPMSLYWRNIQRKF